MRYLKDSEKQYLKEAIDRNVFYIFTGNTFEYLECDNDVKRSINTHYIEKLTKTELDAPALLSRFIKSLINKNLIGKSDNKFYLI